MIHQGLKLLFFTIAINSLIGCSNSPQKVDNVEQPRIYSTEEKDGRLVTNAAASEALAYNFVEISFFKASDTLTDSASKSLEAAVEQARQRGKLDKIMVLSWSDEEYPSKSTKKLSNEQRTLADKRNSAVKKFFSNRKSADVDTYNMAERPTTLSKWFNTTDTRLKNSLIAAGLPSTGDERQYPTKASHSVVLFKIE